MKIELSEGIYWDSDMPVQSEETLIWLNDNVTSKLGLDDSDPNLLVPQKDQFGRPVEWSYEGDGYVIEVTREYIDPNSGRWAKKCDKINVISND